MMTDPSDVVTNDMLAGLAARFAAGAPAEAGGVDYPAGPTFGPPTLTRFVLPGFDGPRTMIGTDGAAGDGLAGFAAVHGDGYVTLGWSRGDRMTPQTAELYAALHGLRRSGAAPVTLLMDNLTVAEALQLMAAKRQIYAAGSLDRQAAREILGLLRHRPLTVLHVPDAEGDTNPKRLPSNRLMAAAHRLAWAARRMAADGIPIEGDALKWLQDLATSAARNQSTIRDRYLETFGQGLDTV